ncbi:MAG: chemotaxis protein [Burkholderiaceae bacterium]|nr:chemotaxis protein [Burkholderiaceae bacterium]
MTKKNLLGSQVKRLLTSLSDHGNQHLTEVETDLVQTTYLLSEAIEKLGASFMAIHEGIAAQKALVDLLLAGQIATPESQEKIKALQDEVAQNVNAAVTGLQFQDMTSQLIARTVRRIAGLRDVLGAVGSSGAEMLPESEQEDVVALLSEVSKALEEQSAKLESVLWKAVSQTHMESGDIELF